MDDKLTKQIQEWLDAPADERDIQEGANLMLKLNRNRVLYQNVLRRGIKMMAKVEYELKKHLQLRLDNMTITDVVRLEKTVVPAIEKLIEDNEKEVAEFAGKRADHDELPEEIQALWDNNFDLYAKIKNLFEELKSMNDKLPCDRYEFLKLLDKAEADYRANLATYDAYVIGQPAAIDADGATSDENPAELATKINNARKYISSNKEKLTALIAAGDEKAISLRAKMQERVDIILTAGVPFTADQQAELESLGIIFK